MLSRDIPEDSESPTGTSTALPRGLDVETVLRRARAERPEYEIRVMSWHRPKRDV